jgi:hypothetical protein
MRLENPNTGKTEAKNQSGGYHTVFRSVKQVTVEIDAELVNFSTRSQPRNKMLSLEFGLCEIRPETGFEVHLSQLFPL